MKFAFSLVVLLVLPVLGLSQGHQTELKALDKTENWQYPYKVDDDKRKKLIDALNEFKNPVDVSDLFTKLGEPDRIDDLSKESKPLSHFETGFLDGSKDVYSFRLIWFARKASKSPGLSDSWLAAYVDKDRKTVSVIHSNYLQTGQGSGIGTGNGTSIGQGPPSDPTSSVRILSKAPANPTEAACRENFSGSVILRVTFLASGEIGAVAVTKAAPYGLDEPAIAAARRLRFQPAKVNGVPTTVTKLVEYKFTCSQ